MYGLGVAPDGLNVYVTDDCLYLVKNYKRDPDTGSLSFQDELSGSPLNGDGLGCLKSLSFDESGVSDRRGEGRSGTERSEAKRSVQPSEIICRNKHRFDVRLTS